MNKILSVSILLISLVFNSCQTLPGSGTTYKKLNLTVYGFMNDCKAGDEINGISVNDVNYTAKISVYTSSNGSTYSLTYGPQIVTTPIPPDRSTFTKEIDIPSNKGCRIEVTIDASECSHCIYTVGCNPITTNSNGIAYKENVGKPYWKYVNTFASGQLGSSFSVIPSPFPRNPNSAAICNCKVRL